MRCEKGKGGFVAAMRSSMERRRVSNAKVTTLRQRKYQELTMQREQENLQRTKEILERRKSERDRLNAYMHSVGNPHAKHPDYMEGMRRPNTEGMFGRPPWTASLRSDYETLIKLREKEIAVATLRIENHKQLPNKSMHSEAKGIIHPNGSDESYQLNNEFEFHHNELEPEFGHKRFDTNRKSNGSSVGSDLKVLETELFAIANEAKKCHTDSGRDLLLLEPTVFREHSFNGLKSGARALPPMVPTSNPKVFTPPLKSCLKSNKHNQKSLSPFSETPRTFSQPSSEQYISRGTSQSTAMRPSRMETAIKPASNGPQTTATAITRSIVKAVKNLSVKPEMLYWGAHQDMDYANESKEHDPYPQSANNMGIPEHLTSMLATSNVVSSEEKVTATAPPGNALSDPAILRPTSGRQTESENLDMLSCSGIDTQIQEKQRDTPNASSPSNTIQQITSIPSALPPRYTSSCESWQEDRDCESSSIADECHTSPLLSPPKKHEDKIWGSEEEMYITSLDSEAATTRLIAEVIAVQSRLEDCKLKPLDLRNIFAEPPFPCRGRSRLDQLGGAEMIPAEDSSVTRSQPAGDDHELGHNQNEQGVIEVTMRNHEIFIPEDISHDDTRESILDEDCTEKEKTTESAASVVGASSVDDHQKDVLSATHNGTDRIDKFTEMHAFEEMESRKTLHGAAWEIPWKKELRQQRRHVEPTADLGCPGVKNQQPANFTVVISPSLCTITTSSKPMGSTLPIDFHSEKIKQPIGLNNQQPCVRHVLLQTDDDLKQSGENGKCHIESEGMSTNPGDLHGGRAESTGDHSDCSLMSTKRTSKYLNIGYRDLSEAPRPKYPKQHCFYSSHGLLQVGYSQPRQSPKTVKQNMPHNNRHGQPCGFHDSLYDKENYGMSGSDDQELSILASLERLDWKLAAMSARVKNRTSRTPSMVSQNQNSIQSAPAATGDKGTTADGTPRKFPVHPLRPSSVRTQKPPTRNFRQRRIVGVTNKFHQDI